jgi:hypothetical protein
MNFQKTTFRSGHAPKLHERSRGPADGQSVCLKHAERMPVTNRRYSRLRETVRNRAGRFRDGKNSVAPTALGGFGRKRLPGPPIARKRSSAQAVIFRAFSPPEPAVSRSAFHFQNPTLRVFTQSLPVGAGLLGTSRHLKTHFESEARPSRCGIGRGSQDYTH